MKATRYLFTALSLAVLALSACTNDDLPGGNTLPEGAVHITAGIEGVQTRAPQLDANGAGSFESTDMWGMYTFTGDAASPAYSNQNIAYRADNSNPLKWKDLSETEAVTFSAHYPRITGTMPDIDDPAAYMYMPQAWNHTDDLLHATATASKGRNGGTDIQASDAPARRQPGGGRWHGGGGLVFRPDKLRGKGWLHAYDVCQRGGEPADRRSDLWQSNGQCNAQQRKQRQCRLDSSTARPHRRCGMAQNNHRRGCVVLSCTCRPEPCRARQPNPPRKRQAAHPQPQVKEKLRHGRHRGGTHRQQHLRLGHAAGDYG